jgi:hypothetical protein
MRTNSFAAAAFFSMQIFSELILLTRHSSTTKWRIAAAGELCCCLAVMYRSTLIIQFLKVPLRASSDVTEKKLKQMTVSLRS